VNSLIQILKLSSIPTVEPVVPPSERSIPKEVSMAKLKGFLEKMKGLENMSKEKVEECVKPQKSSISNWRGSVVVCLSCKDEKNSLIEITIHQLILQ